MGRGRGGMVIGAGVLLVVVGLCLVGMEKLGGLWRLPGDIDYRGRNVRVFAPLGTCLVLSVVLSVVLWLVGKMRH